MDTNNDFKSQDNFIDKIMHVEKLFQKFPNLEDIIKQEENNIQEKTNLDTKCNAETKELSKTLNVLFSRFSNKELLSLIRNNYKCCSMFLLIDFLSRARMLLDGESYNKVDFKKQHLPVLSKNILSPFISSKFAKSHALLKFLFNYYLGISESCCINPNVPTACYQENVYEMCELLINAVKQKSPQVFQIYQKLEKNEKISTQEILDMLREYQT